MKPLFVHKAIHPGKSFASALCMVGKEPCALPSCFAGLSIPLKGHRNKTDMTRAIADLHRSQKGEWQAQNLHLYWRETGSFRQSGGSLARFILNLSNKTMSKGTRKSQTGNRGGGHMHSQGDCSKKQETKAVGWAGAIFKDCCK